MKLNFVFWYFHEQIKPWRVLYTFDQNGFKIWHLVMISARFVGGICLDLPLNPQVFIDPQK